jgi:hypothetical protein
MKKLLFATLGTVLIAIIGAGIFYACKKENSEPVLKSTTPSYNEDGTLVNPFEYVGEWHNGCLEYMFSNFNASTMTEDELWLNYGVPYFQNILGEDYVDIPLSELNSIYMEIEEAINARNSVHFLEKSAATGKINPTFTSPYLVTENNYQLLYELYTLMDNIQVHTETEYLQVQNFIEECEQKILVNYYSLLENNVISIFPEAGQDDVLYNEYKNAMICMAIARNSGRYWFYSGGDLVGLDSWEVALRCQQADFQVMFGTMDISSMFTAIQASSKASSSAGIYVLFY